MANSNNKQKQKGYCEYSDKKANDSLSFIYIRIIFLS